MSAQPCKTSLGDLSHFLHADNLIDKPIKLKVGKINYTVIRRLIVCYWTLEINITQF